MDWTQGSKIQVVWEVLEAARETGEKTVIDACVRLIDAERCVVGRKRRPIGEL